MYRNLLDCILRKFESFSINLLIRNGCVDDLKGILAGLLKKHLIHLSLNRGDKNNIFIQ